MKSKKLRLSSLYGLVFAAELVLTILTMLIRNRSLSYFALADALGLVGLLCLTAGLILFIFQGGFFDGILYSFRRFARAWRQKQLHEPDPETPLAEYKVRDGRRWPVTWPVLAVSLILVLVSLLLSLSLL
ncbi:DUF3899 domain-containing protein [Sporolactobacillus vineae]|uniref:DUF3899 domain-containing protein n=1 Tax=Sporolactobacillus vineae TaxID=444463 RepID=UPI00028925DA|nr:DUF3899 domain-containing protein [Sporolactobacillus vineae]